jgi:tetratricopeptide (TPR) repeat protein
MVGDAWAEAIELESAGQHRRAYERFQRCLEMPELDRADILFHMGWCIEADHGDVEVALAHYLKAAESALDPPLMANANYRAGLLAFDAGRLPQAIALMERTRTIVASHPALQDLDNHAAYWLGICYEADGRILDAVGLYDAVGKSAEPRLGAEARYRQMLGLVFIGAFDAALGVARDWIRADNGGDERIAQLADLAARERNQVLLALADA